MPNKFKKNKKQKTVQYNIFGKKSSEETKNIPKFIGLHLVKYLQFCFWDDKYI